MSHLACLMQVTSLLSLPRDMFKGGKTEVVLGENNESSHCLGIPSCPLQNWPLCLLSKGQLSFNEPVPSAKTKSYKGQWRFLTDRCDSRCLPGQWERKHVKWAPELTSNGTWCQRGDYWGFGPIIDSGQKFKQQAVLSHGVDNSRHGKHGT